MKISVGILMIIIGSVGALVCLSLFCASWMIFAKRRKKLLKELEKM